MHNRPFKETDQMKLDRRRKELFAKYPDAILMKAWMEEEAVRQRTTRNSIRVKLTKGQLQPKIIKLTRTEVYVIP